MIQKSKVPVDWNQRGNHLPASQSPTPRDRAHQLTDGKEHYALQGRGKHQAHAPVADKRIAYPSAPSRSIEQGIVEHHGTGCDVWNAPESGLTGVVRVKGGVKRHFRNRPSGEVAIHTQLDASEQDD